MAWSVFKSTLLSSMQSNAFGNNISGFARTFTISYDFAIKSGFDTLNKVPIVKGNTELMQSTLESLMLQTQLSSTFTLLDIIGPAIIGYWTGAQLSLFPPPIIPSIGAIQNVASISSVILSPGIWTPIPTLPNNNSSIFLDLFINSAKIHLTTVSGLFSTISQYPPPAPPAPGVVMWTGYFVSD